MFEIILFLMVQSDLAGGSFEITAARDIEQIPKAHLAYQVPEFLLGYDLVFAQEGVVDAASREVYSYINTSPWLLFDKGKGGATLEDLVRFYQGIQSLFSRDYGEAAVALQGIADKYPHESLGEFASYFLGSSLYREERFRDALRIFARIGGKDRAYLSSRSQFMIAQAYKGLSLGDSAVSAFQKARSASRNTMIDLYSTYTLYEMYNARGNLSAAEEEASRLEKIELEDIVLTEALTEYVRGNMKFRQEDYQTALEHYAKVQANPPRFDEETSIEELTIYEASLAMSILALNRSGNFTDAMNKPQSYLDYFTRLANDKLRGEDEAIAARFGRGLRVYLLYNWADALYYSSYDAEGRIENVSRREQAHRTYEKILDDYSDAEVADMARVALAWYDLEASRLTQAQEEFEEILEASVDPDVKVLASYGKALALYHEGSYSSAYEWFTDKAGYASKLSVAVAREEAHGSVRYNQIADSLIDDALVWRAQSAEMLGRESSALIAYQQIADDYPDRSTAALAWQNMVRLYLDKDDEENAILASNKLKFRKTRNPGIYAEPYIFSLALLYDYYMNVKDDENQAEEYAKILLRETGNTEIVERLYYTQAMRYTDVSDMDRLIEKITRLKEQNYQSKYLVAPLYNLSLMYVQDKRFAEAKEALLDLAYWHDTSALGGLMPDIEFRLAYVDFQMRNYSDAARQFEIWTNTYTAPDKARADLAPAVYWYLGFSYYNLAEDPDLMSQTRAGYYRKAKRYFEYLKSSYGNSDFYDEDVSVRIERLVPYCEKKITELLKP
ncbi:hypothetical protein JXM67_07640 [candidate division WOR-3 bacterium]|nr:hypothetical protein [candidate division WOR-3 bacterium]